MNSVGVDVPHCNFRDFSLFNVGNKSYNCPSARCASAAIAIGHGFATFIVSSVWINDLPVFDTFSR